jgi:hypothetical protein
MGLRFLFDGEHVTMTGRADDAEQIVVDALKVAGLD